MKGSRFPTIKDIAARLGVANSTVSMALRNDPRISSTTRRRVREMAQVMGYQVNPLVAALMTQLQRSRDSQFKPNLALIHCHPVPRERQASPHFRELLRGANDQARSLGYNISEFWLEADGMRDERLDQILETRGINGLILEPAFLPNRKVNFDQEKFSVVAIGYSFQLPDVSRVCPHQLHAITVAMRRLYELGYQRIGLAISKNMDHRVDHNYRAGYLLMQDYLTPVSKVPILWMEESMDDSSFDTWLNQHHPDAILSPHIEIQHKLEERQFSIPKDIGFAHLDTLDEYQGISGFHQRWFELGSTAVELLIGMIQRNERGGFPYAKTVMIEGEWVPGKTLRQVSKTP